MIFALIFLGVCTFILIKNVETTVGDILTCSFISLIFFSFAIIPFIYNRKAYLHIDDDKIIGRFGFFNKLECNISDITFVLPQFDTLHIVLNDRKYSVKGINNAYDISAYIRQKIPFSPYNVTEEIIEKHIKEPKKKQKNNIILVFCMLILSFAWLFITVFLTEEKELSEFTRTDWIYFCIMLILEIPTVISMYVFAIKSGKGNLQFQKHVYKIKRSIVESTPLLSGPGCLKSVFTDSECSQRITLYCNCVENDPLSVCYNVEIIDESFNLIFQYQSEIVTIENVNEMFVGTLDITNKFV